MNQRSISYWYIRIMHIFLRGKNKIVIIIIWFSWLMFEEFELCYTHAHTRRKVFDNNVRILQLLSNLILQKTLILFLLVWIFICTRQAKAKWRDKFWWIMKAPLSLELVSMGLMRYRVCPFIPLFSICITYLNYIYSKWRTCAYI